MVSVDLQTPRNFAGLLWESAEVWPGRVAIDEAGTPTTYAALRDRAACIAASLRTAGAHPGDRVVVLLSRGTDAAAAVFAVLAVGAIVTMISEESTPPQIAHMCRTLGARLLLTSVALLTPERKDAMGDTRALLVEASPSSAALRPVERRADDPAQVTFTSGSTGAPKGVVASHQNLWAGVAGVQAYLGIESSDRVASLLPFAFVYGFNQLTLALACGATLVIERSALPPVLVKALSARGVTVMAAVPPLWHQLLAVEAFRTPWPALRLVTNAGGHLAPALVRSLRAAQPQARLFLMYGLTEVFRSTFLDPSEVDAHPDSMGRALPGSRVHVIRNDGTECDDDEIGEVIHGGPTVALGYWNDPDATARVFRDDPLAREAGNGRPGRVVFTGDLARRDREGRLYHCGRRDAIIKTLGFRVSPDEITDVLVASGQVAECAVHGIADEVRGQAIVAHVVLRDGGSMEALRASIGRALPRHMHPLRTLLHTALPRTANGKIDIPALRAVTAVDSRTS